jgi:predicted AlkP superfamily pyrophosphatase or phosphodiesterase
VRTVIASALLATAVAVTPAAATDTSGVAARASAASASTPLVYIVVLDGLDGDLYDAGRLPFLRGLVDTRGTYYQESRGVMLSETNPNHTAMITGAYADTSGIPANDFALYPDAAAGCPVAPGRGPSEAGLSAKCVLAETFFQSTARGTVKNRITSAGVFGKPKLATLFSAKRSKGRYAADYLWTPCASARPDYCRRVPLNAMGYANDEDTMNAVLKAVRKGVPAERGTRRTPNLLIANLAGIDVAGHTYGAGSRYRKAATAGDAQIQRFVRQQKRLGLWQRTVLFVVSDHSMATNERKVSLTAGFEAAGIPRDSYVIVQNGGTNQVYLTDRTSPERFALLQRLRQAALATDGVDEALYREANPLDPGHDLRAVHPEWHLAGERTGDLVVTQAAGGAFTDPSNPVAGGHGGPNTLDTIFVITGGWKGLARNGTLPRRAENVDVAPTALHLLGLQPPRDNRGRLLAEAFSR